MQGDITIRGSHERSRFFPSKEVGDNFHIQATACSLQCVHLRGLALRMETLQYQHCVVALAECLAEGFNNCKGVLAFEDAHEVKDENKQEDQKTGWVRNEYTQRSFSRSFTLDETVDVNKIQATYTDGILRIVLGKNEKAKPVSRTIEIK